MRKANQYKSKLEIAVADYLGENAEYEREHLRDYGETKEEFIRRKYCE